MNPPLLPSAGGFLRRLCTVCFLFMCVGLAHGQQVARTSPAGTKMLVYTPPGYATSTSTFPLLVFLHGGAEIGDDLSRLTTGTSHQYPPKLISINQWDTRLPFIVVSPQLKRDLSVKNYNDQEWPAAYVDEAVEYVRKNYRVDAYRIYFTGVSLGSHGVWTYAARYPSKVAAMVTISGKSDPATACAVKNIPVWAFHGENDAWVKPSFSINMVNAIRACSPAPVYKPRLNLLYARLHEGWNEIYNRSNGYDVFNWMLKFRRGNTANKTPYVNAGRDLKIALRSTPFTLAGDFFDWNGTVSAIRWTKVSGPAVTMGGTSTAFLTLSALKAGLYEFQLSVTDNHGAVSSDRVKLEIVSPAAPPAVTSLVLMNGRTNADIGVMKEGMVINKTTLGTTEFNIRAGVSTGVGSVRFSVNSDQHTRTINASGPYLIRKPASAPEWTMNNGTHVICATPYPQTGGRGTPGATLCYRVSVTQSSTVSASSQQLVAHADQIAIRAIDDILISNRGAANQWVLNGVDIEGATGPVFKPVQPGEYYVRITDRPGRDLSNVVAFDLPEMATAKRKLTIYPNPPDGYLEVAGDGVGERSSYRIIRAGGAVVQQGALSAGNRIILPPAMQSGEYILVVATANGNETAKFIVR